MWKKAIFLLIACVVGTVVVTVGRQLYLARHQLFRPDFARAGGTEFVFDLDGPATEDEIDAACAVLRKRLDQEGSAGVVVSREEDRIIVAVPNGSQHDEVCGWARRLAIRTGRVEFRMLANETDDKLALDTARISFLASKKPPVKPGALAGDELVMAVRGEAAERYRWYRQSDGLARQWMSWGGRAPAGGGGPREVLASHYGTIPLHIIRTGGPGGSTEQFLLCREPPEAERLGSEAIQRARLTSKDARMLARVDVTFEPEAAKQMMVFTSRYSSPARGRSDNRPMAVILDGEIVAVDDLYSPIQRRHTFDVWVTLVEAEEMAVMMRGGELKVKLKPMPKERTVLAK